MHNCRKTKCKIHIHTHIWQILASNRFVSPHLLIHIWLAHMKPFQKIYFLRHFLVGCALSLSHNIIITLFSYSTYGKWIRAEIGRISYMMWIPFNILYELNMSYPTAPISTRVYIYMKMASNQSSRAQGENWKCSIFLLDTNNCL